MSDTDPAAAPAAGTLTPEQARERAGLPAAPIMVGDRVIDARTPAPFHPYWAIREELLPAIAKASFGGGLDQLASLTEQFAADAAAPSAAGGVAVVPLRGVITPRASLMSILFGGGGGLQAFRRSFRDAVESDDVSAILIDVDSPGGSTDLVAETAADVRNARGSKPIVAVANTMAASAAYWIASQADELVITPSGEVGSIGVFSLHEEFSKMDEQLGITTTIVRAGKHKFEANPYEPLTEEAHEALQESVDEFYGMFVGDVAKGRSVNASAVKRDFGEGRMVTAKKAVAAGMADRVATFEEAAKKLVGRRPRRSSDQGARGASTDQTRARDLRALRLAQPRH